MFFLPVVESDQVLSKPIFRKDGVQGLLVGEAVVRIFVERNLRKLSVRINSVSRTRIYRNRAVVREIEIISKRPAVLVLILVRNPKIERHSLSGDMHHAGIVGEFSGREAYRVGLVLGAGDIRGEQLGFLTHEIVFLFCCWICAYLSIRDICIAAIYRIGEKQRVGEAGNFDIHPSEIVSVTVRELEGGFAVYIAIHLDIRSALDRRGDSLGSEKPLVAAVEAEG